MSADDVLTDDDTANAADRMRQADYGTVRDWNGKPSTPSPLPDETPFSVAAGTALTNEPDSRHDELMDVVILRSLTARYLDDDGDGYGGVPFISRDEAIRALTTDRERYAAAALAEPVR